MNTSVRNDPPSGRPLRTSDLAAAGSRPETPNPDDGSEPSIASADRGTHRVNAAEADESERLEPLFPSDRASDYRARWNAVQSSFVDDPRQAVQQGDELVAQVMQSLAETFAEERDKLESQLGETGEASTETLRVALRRYRSFFERLLSL